MFSILAILLALVASLAVTGGFVWAGRRYPGRLTDNDFAGPQKVHDRAVPRVGGIGIAAGLWLAAGVLWLMEPAAIGKPALWLLACGLPTLLAGLAEDITKRVSPSQRLLWTALSAALAIGALGVTLNRTDLPGLDWAVAFAPFAMLLTVFAVAGVANSINLIDGFNGLASTCVALMLGGLAWVGWQVGDSLVTPLALAGVAAVLGFLAWNYPRGLIFLGDGGAYFLGFFLAELGLMLSYRNPQVSPLFPLLLVIYPVFETVFSMYRRKWLQRKPVGQPDASHLHSLIFRRCLHADFAALDSAERVRRNSMTSPFLWALTLLSVVPALLFWDNSPMLIVCGVGFCVVYVTIYWRIVRFKLPRSRPAAGAAVNPKGAPEIRRTP
ncbi:MAG: glycosyltransferase [Pseudomonadota bacterium]|nr:glycosyltransferase [Pseudomonadota bacterium]